MPRLISARHRPGSQHSAGCEQGPRSVGDALDVGVDRLVAGGEHGGLEARFVVGEVADVEHMALGFDDEPVLLTGDVVPVGLRRKGSP